MRCLLLSLPLAAMSFAALGGGVARADVRAAIRDQILPGYAALTDASHKLAEQGAQDCTVAAMQPEWNAAFDAWLDVAYLRLGPVEEEGRALAFAFWPDPKAIGRRQLQALKATADRDHITPEAMSEGSIATRGFFGMYHLLYGEMAQDDAFSCALRQAQAEDLAQMAMATEIGWQNGFADQLLNPGAQGKTRYLDEAEARQALYTQLISGLEFNKDQRLGRPLGSFDRPRPERAEMIEAGRSAENLDRSLHSLERFAQALAQGMGPIPNTTAAFARAHELVADLEDPVFAGVASPGERLRVEILQQQIALTVEAVDQELGPLLGVSAGFNAADGD